VLTQTHYGEKGTLLHPLERCRTPSHHTQFIHPKIATG